MDRIDLSKIKPAPYNPRHLPEGSRETLRKSLETLGVIKPILVNRSNGTIVAGHQRTSVLKEMGVTECIGYYLDGVNEADEVRFNQLHNKCEYETSDKQPKIRIHPDAPMESGRIYRVSPSMMEVEDKGTLALYNQMLMRLFTKYGEFAMPLCNPEGEIKISAGYAYAAKILNKEIDVMCLSSETLREAVRFMGADYGEFSYDNIERETYRQSFAQMYRLREGKQKTPHIKSTLYEVMVLPFLKDRKDLRILDFGAGQYDYAKMLAKNGYNIKAIDPYHRKGAAIAFTENVATYRAICKDLEQNGKYDVVICDSVLNSVDSPEAERSVLATLMGLCKEGGHIFVSGRLAAAAAKKELIQTKKPFESYVLFPDKDGFTATYSRGGWFFQKYHTDKQIRAILEVFGGEGKINTSVGQTFKIAAINHPRLTQEEIIMGLRFEFDLPLPNGKRYGLADEIEKSYRYVISNH